MGFSLKKIVSQVTAPVAAVVSKVTAPVAAVVNKVTAPALSHVQKATSHVQGAFSQATEQLKTGNAILAHHTGKVLAPIGLNVPSAFAPRQAASDYSAPVYAPQQYINEDDPINDALPPSAFEADNGAGSFADFMANFGASPAQDPSGAFSSKATEAPAATASRKSPVVVAIVAGVAIVAAVLVFRKG